MSEEDRAGLPPWDERRELYVAGLLSLPVRRLVPALMEELARVGLTWGKDGSAVDVPPAPGTVAVDVGGGQTVHIRPDAYREDGHPRAEVRERPARTDLAILGALAGFEGGQEQDEKRLREGYQRLFEGMPGAGFAPVPTEIEKALVLARRLLEDRDPTTFAGMSDRGRRERVVSIARRVGTVAKALRELDADLEAGTTRPKARDAQLDVLAAELRCLYGLSWKEIGKRLDIPLTPSDERRNENLPDSRHDNQRARKAGERGLKLLNEARRSLALPLLRLP